MILLLVGAIIGYLLPRPRPKPKSINTDQIWADAKSYARKTRIMRTNEGEL